MLFVILKGHPENRFGQLSTELGVQIGSKEPLCDMTLWMWCAAQMLRAPKPGAMVVL